MMNRRSNDASPEPAPHLGVFLVATGNDADCRPEMIRTFLQKNVGAVRIVTSSRSYTNEKLFLTMEFASPNMVKNAIDNYNYTRVNGCLININRFRSKTMQGRNSFGGFQKGFTVKQDGSRHGRVHQTIRGRMQGTRGSKADRERAMDDKMQQMSPASAARYIETRLHSKRGNDRSRSGSRSSSGSGRRAYSDSRSRSRSYSHSASRSRSRSPRRRRATASRSRSRSASKSRSRSRSRSRSASHRRSRSPDNDDDSYRRSRRRGRGSGRRRSSRLRSSGDEKEENALDSITAGEVMLTMPVDSLGEDEQRRVQDKRDEMTTEYRQDCNTVIQVARLFSSYSRHLERDLEKTLRCSLAGIGQRYVKDFQGWLKETVPHAVEEVKLADTAIEAA